jgi:hypothetical protein
MKDIQFQSSNEIQNHKVNLKHCLWILTCFENPRKPNNNKGETLSYGRLLPID